MTEKKHSKGPEPMGDTSSLSLLKQIRLNLPIIGKILLFILIMFVFYLVFTSSYFRDSIFDPINMASAKISSLILNLFGFNTTCHLFSISSPEFNVNIAMGCDGIEPTMIYIAVVLLTPVFWKYRLIGILAGSIGLLIINLFRIITLFLIGIYAPTLFDVIHLDVWQALFIIITIAVYLSWLSWTIKKQKNAVA